MNTSRIVAGGLVAGLVLNVGETLLNVPVAGKQLAAAMSRLGLPAMGGASIGIFVAMCFLLGILSVWLYAAIRPRFGAGPRTAVIAGIVIWLLTSVWGGVAMNVMGIMPTGLTLLGIVWEAIEMPLAVAAGAYFYKEEESARVATGAD